MVTKTWAPLKFLKAGLSSSSSSSSSSNSGGSGSGGGGGSISRVVYSAFIYIHRHMFIRMCRLYMHVNKKEILLRMSC
jgi:uncharacterized spore protein YtfJ